MPSLAIELHDTDAAALLLPLIEPFAAEVAFSGLTSQGPVGAYVGKLSSLLGRHEEAEDHLRAALATATRLRLDVSPGDHAPCLEPGPIPGAGSAGSGSPILASTRPSDLCRRFGFRSWIPQIDELAATITRPDTLLTRS